MDTAPTMPTQLEEKRRSGPNEAAEQALVPLSPAVESVMLIPPQSLAAGGTTSVLGVLEPRRARRSPSTTALSTALSFVSQQRVVVDNSLTRLTAATDAANSEQTQLTGAQTTPMQADVAKISTQLSMAETRQTALEDVISQLGAGSLFDKLQG